MLFQKLRKGHIYLVSVSQNSVKIRRGTRAIETYRANSESCQIESRTLISIFEQDIPRSEKRIAYPRKRAEIRSVPGCIRDQRSGASMLADAVKLVSGRIHRKTREEDRAKEADRRVGWEEGRRWRETIWNKEGIETRQTNKDGCGDSGRSRRWMVARNQV